MELTTSILITDAARSMVRLEAQARHEQRDSYWTTSAWLRREVVQQERSRQLRERWSERRLAQA